MRLEELAQSGFRNLVTERVALAPTTTLLVGDNGQGKTSFLEAAGVLATTRSFRKARAAEMIRQGGDSLVVRGLVSSESGARTELLVSHERGRGKRSTRVGGAEVELSEYVGRLVVIAITAAHAGIVRGGPQERRDFLDRGVLGERPGYLAALAAHRRSLRQKNALLRQPGGPSEAELAAWNGRLAQDAAQLVVRRREYVDRLQAILEELGPRVLPRSETLELELQDVVSRAELACAPGGVVPALQTVADALRERMDELSAREVAAGQALVGAHRDELELTCGGAELRRFASSGQQRNALLALKMAKIELFRRARGEAPVLLVDDVDTEIDPSRLRTFLEEVSGTAQAIITSSKPELLMPSSRGLVYRVEAGVIRPA